MVINIRAASGNLDQYLDVLNKYKFNGESVIEVDSLEELFRFYKELKIDIIVSENYKDEPSIQIYDDYLE